MNQATKDMRQASDTAVREPKQVSAGTSQMALPFSADILPPTLRELGSKPALMMFKFFALGREEREFDIETPVAQGKLTISVAASEEHGPATQTDKTVLNYIVATIAKSAQVSGRIPETVTINVADYVKAMCRSRSGQAYQQLARSIERLQDTRVTVTRTFDNAEIDDVKDRFTWIQHVRTRYRSKKGGDGSKSLHSVSLELCNWLKLALQHDPSLVVYDPDYHTLTSPLLQRVYELVMSDTENDICRIPMDRFYTRVGTGTGERKLKHQLKNAFEANLKRIGDLGGKADYPIPQHSIYVYDDRSPSRSVDWSRKVRKENLWFVFCRDLPQREKLDLNLENIPVWNPKVDERDLQIITGDIV